ncbi:MAG: tRNA uridine-5-carboxymethylaminomethyl(34) synthesis enzyme MnmG, partial [Xanthomonadales bacterium]|nr:tRNA uridine-5-carboxymethylaminomethyl(34) synthesis enzyme MnmG [Xanthomonadales bacterium]
YRMFTSRAEYRLQLREDNADLRLTDIGRELGLVDDQRWARFAGKREQIDREIERLRGLWASPGNALGQQLAERLGQSLTRESSAFDLLKRPELSYAELVAVEGIGPGVDDPQAREQVEIQSRYEGYLVRQQVEIERNQRHDGQAIPIDFDYAQLSGLSAEVRQKLQAVRPSTLGQAGRIPGVTPAAVSLLLIHLQRRSSRVA